MIGCESETGGDLKRRKASHNEGEGLRQCKEEHCPRCAQLPSARVRIVAWGAGAGFGGAGMSRRMWLRYGAGPFVFLAT